jgi:hypothetical protein
MHDAIETEAADAGPGRRRARRIVALAALTGFVLLLLWARGLPGFVAWELARDHERCFGQAHLRAKLWSSDPAEIRGWLESRGTPVQPLPGRPGQVEIVGVRYCPLADRVAAHVYYGGQSSLVSVFVLSGPVRIGDGWSGRVRKLQVRMLRSAGRTLAIVGESDSDVDAVAHAFELSVA